MGEILTSDEGKLVLPVEPEKAVRFISSILSNPDTSSRKFVEDFRLDKSDILALNNFIKNKIQPFVSGGLISSSARIYFDDQGIEELSNIEKIQEFDTNSPRKSTSVNLTWAFFINSEGSGIPERQVVDISFSDKIGLGKAGLRESDSRDSNIHIRITYTNRDWAEMLMLSIAKYIESGIVSHPPSMRSWVSDHGFPITLTSVLLVLGVSFWGIYSKVLAFTESYKLRWLGVDRSVFDVEANISQKMDLLFDVVISGAWSKITIFVAGFTIFALILSILTGVFVAISTEYTTKSFVLLSKKSVDDWEKYEKRKNRDWPLFFLALIFPYVISFIVSYVQEWLLNLI